MRLYRLIAIIFIFFVNLSFANCKNPIYLNINNLEINTFIKSVAKITNKNILLTNKIDGNINFISNNPICEKDIYNLLLFILEDKGYTIIQKGKVLKIVKMNDRFNKGQISNRVIRLKNIEAKNVLNIINPIIKDKKNICFNGY